ncbi:alpha/beta hydrolase [Muricauda sp. ANG21]|uniref:alpha/beta hydrolase n=1 Tax=Allomuricauda sp. ANG21 TaxID=3042468 RepID=UPI003455C506
MIHRLGKIGLVTFVIFTMTEYTNAQNVEIKLWDTEIPGARTSKAYIEQHDFGLDQVRNVKTPTLRIFVPEKPNGTAIIICPGGGYTYLAIRRSGIDVAKWLNTLGITAFVLKYRLPSDDIMENKSVAPLQDAQKAMRYVRGSAEQWNLDKEKIGIMGFSAGGHLASTLATRYDESVYKRKDTISAKPNFSLLIYPVISMIDALCHKGSRNRLLGTKPNEEAIHKFSNEKHVDSLTALTFIAHASDDTTVSVKNSLAYYSALSNHGVPAELHLYQNGKHGFFLGKKGTTSQTWPEQCEAWLRHNDFIE